LFEFVGHFFAVLCLMILRMLVSCEKRTMARAKSPDPTDKHVGNRVRMRRMMLDMSQTKLGDALGITFQQVQKYEKGTNRISASRLQQSLTFCKYLYHSSSTAHPMLRLRAARTVDHLRWTN
jgi:DNA-binding XRE family transcriptional regulator